MPLTLFLIVHIPFRLIVGAVFYYSMPKNDDRANNEAKQIISQEIDNVNTNPSIVKVNGCAACHVLFSIVDKMHVNESEASDLLSQILFYDPQLNESFIEMVESIHMKQR